MANGNPSSGGSPGNPGVVEIEPVHGAVAPDWGRWRVTLEMVDRAGDGFKTIFDVGDALDTALRMVGAVMKLRGLTP
jgi:hypothetical protein